MVALTRIPRPTLIACPHMLVGGPIVAPTSREALFDRNLGAAATGGKAHVARPFTGNDISFQEKHLVTYYS